MGSPLDLENCVDLFLVIEHGVSPFERDDLETVVLLVFFDWAVSSFRGEVVVSLDVSVRHDEFELGYLDFTLWLLTLASSSRVATRTFVYHFDLLFDLVNLLNIDFWLDEPYVFDVRFLELLNQSLLAESF